MSNNLSKFRTISMVSILCLSGNALADIYKNNAFLYGDNIEVGIGPDGAFGSDVVSPDDTRKSYGRKLGYISDPSGNNFQASYHGDFFLPGIPEEGWGVGFDGKAYNNNNNQQVTGVLGSLSDFKSSADAQSVTWKGRASVEKENGDKTERIESLEITQVYSIYTRGMAIVIDVTLKNITDKTMYDVYYMRTVDPDNNAEQDTEVQSVTKYITTNTIISQGSEDGVAVVAASQDAKAGLFTKSLLTLTGYGNNARVTYGGERNRLPEDVFTGIDGTNGKDPLIQTGSKKADESISVAFKFDKLEPGDEVRVRGGYLLADVPVPNIDIDNSSDASGNGFEQLYFLGGDPRKITAADILIDSGGLTQLSQAMIILTNPHDGDLLEIAGDLPAGISLNEEASTETKKYLTGLASITDYETALKLFQYQNQNVHANIETRVITIQLVDRNSTPSNSASSIINITTPVELDDLTIEGDNAINENEKGAVKFAGHAAPNATLVIDFTDSQGNKISKTVATDDEGNWSLASDPADLSSLDEGLITVLITATDGNGNVSSLTKEIIKDSIIILDNIVPADNEVVSSSTPIYTGKTDPNASITLKILPDGKVYTGSADSNGDWSIQLDKFALGVTTEVLITTKDEYGNEKTATLHFITPNLPIELTDLDANMQGMAYSSTPTIKGTSEPNTTISINMPTINGQITSCTTTTDADGKWACTLPASPVGGPYTLTVTTTDSNGNTNSTTQQISIPELSLAVDSPTDNELVSSTMPTFSGTSEPNATITLKVLPDGKTYTTTADAQGNWSIDVDEALPKGKTVDVEIKSTDGVNESTIARSIQTPNLPINVTDMDSNAQGVAHSITPTLKGTSEPNTTISINMPTINGQITSCTTTTDADGKWACTLPASPVGGPYTLTVTTTDSNGNTNSTTQQISIPELSLAVDSPTDNELVSSTMPTFSGTSEPNATITLKVLPDGKTYTTTADAQGNWSIDVDEALPKGKTVDVEIKSTDGVNESTITRSIQTPNLPIKVTDMDSNAQGVAHSMTPTLKGTSEPDTTIHITMPTTDGKTTICDTTTDAEGNWSCTLPVSPSGGPYDLTVTTTDSEGNTNSTTEEISIPDLPLIIDSPADNAVISGVKPVVKGTSKPGTKIKVVASNGSSCTAITDDTNHWSCELPELVFDENYTLTITAEDDEGNIVTQTLDVLVDKLPLAIIAPEDNSTTDDTTPVFIGTTTANTEVTVTAEGGQSCTTKADSEGHWTCELPRMPVGGPYDVVVKAVDGHGNQTTITEKITIPAIPLVVGSPADGELIKSSNATVTGKTDPNSPVKVLGPDGEMCETTSDATGAWSCELENLQSGLNKHITVISGDNQKVTVRVVDIENSSEKVKTVLSGSPSIAMLFLLGLFGLLRVFRKISLNR